MKILLYGSRGWIGTQFLEILEGAGVSVMCGKARVDNIPDVISELDAYHPTHVVSLMGRTHGTIDDQAFPTIDYLEEPGKLTENVRDNLFGPLSLALLAKEHGFHFTYLGTGCIFNYDTIHSLENGKGFTEASLPNFWGSSYSTIKGYTDRLMGFFGDSVLNLRIRMPITGTANPRNFITKIATYSKICSISNSMSVLPSLLPLVLDMMKQKTVGTVNLTNPGVISHNEILELYREIVDPNFTWNTFTLDEQRKVLASERSNNCLDTTRLVELFPTVPSIGDAVRNCLLTYPVSISGCGREVVKESLATVTVPEEYIPKCLLVTGGCGFIGSHFINHILDHHASVHIINLDAMYYCANLENIKEIHRNSSQYTFIRGNINSSDLVKHILEHYKIDSVVHFAAQSHVQSSFENSQLFTRDNVMGTHTLLECCRLYGGIQRFVHVSTDEVYGESMNQIEETHKTEHSILCPTNPIITVLAFLLSLPVVIMYMDRDNTRKN
jgi:3,5-epimerase/4-reductase